MKKISLLFIIAVLVISCKEKLVKEPNNLVDKETMVNIMYDLSILDGIKYQNLSSLDSLKINPNKYILKKYKIDSVTFSKSNSYYASTSAEYSALIDQVNNKLVATKAKVDKEIAKEVKRGQKMPAKRPLLNPVQSR